VPRILFALIATLAALLAATSAAACSSSRDYVAPSNFELVQMAEAVGIYVAEAPPPAPAPVAAAGTDTQVIGGFGDPVIFRLERTLAGAPPATLSLLLAGMIDPRPHDPDDADLPFRFANYGGGCSALTFERGARYLMILKRETDGHWYPVHYGGSRATEDYGSDASPWARTVRRYLALRALHPAAQTAALVAMRDSGRDRDGTPLLPVERADIVQHLRAPSQWKPTEWLLDRYERASRGEAVDIDLSGPIQWDLRNDARLTLLTSLANGHHPAARALFERLLETPASGGRDLALALHYFSGNGLYPRAYRWIETRLTNRLLSLNTAGVRLLLSAVEGVQRGEDYDYGHERWRSDPHVAATWPELALSLYWFQANRLRNDEREFYDTAFEAIPVSDYRARPLLSVALAASGNDRALAWAYAELARLPVPSDEPGEHQEDERQRDRRDEAARLPLRMLVTEQRMPVDGQEDANERALVRAFCQGGIRRRTVIEVLRLWGDPDYHQLLGEMATFAGLTPVERSRALQAVLQMSGRGLDDPDYARNLADPDSPWLITRLLRSQPAWVPPQATGESPALTCPA
jgi:hypothetical protein